MRACIPLLLFPLPPLFSCLLPPSVAPPILGPPLLLCFGRRGRRRRGWAHPFFVLFILWNFLFLRRACSDARPPPLSLCSLSLHNPTPPHPHTHPLSSFGPSLYITTPLPFHPLSSSSFPCCCCKTTKTHIKRPAPTTPLPRRAPCVVVAPRQCVLSCVPARESRVQLFLFVHAAARWPRGGRRPVPGLSPGRPLETQK